MERRANLPIQKINSPQRHRAKEKCQNRQHPTAIGEKARNRGILLSQVFLCASVSLWCGEKTNYAVFFCGIFWAIVFIISSCAFFISSGDMSLMCVASDQRKP